ncbi:MAG: Efflux transport system, outer membrane factor (OMF) lipoprotein [uncultured Sphingomonas sp.]|uniref:Efflux transport system, outer membrane factor (OMF) lipoprotein n=1 Tax=uncultured Sphingomonas sp. TaxID=158754 RepID=A0A6J4S9G3_9SPHN|nr:MAG: Efflux transport system, outer membrane factor (OMF) lipoprotein [uncultured Sphingomonas sp.]
MRHCAALLGLLAAGCTTMEPAYVRPETSVSPSWPVGDPYLRAVEAPLPAFTYRDMFQDLRLQTLVQQALANNRDLRVAAANIVAARERYRIQRSNQLPQVDATGGATATSREAATATGGRERDFTAQYNLGAGINNFELDLFGRLRSQSNAELNRYFATEAGARATRLTLVGDIADAWLAHAADQSLLLIAQQTADSAQRSVRLTRLRLEGGVAPRTDLRQAEQILFQAQADLAQQRTAVAQDVNLLQLLVGGPIARGYLSGSIEEAAGTVVALPAGTSSYVLLRRPDVVEAEYQLRAANADIGAARAALFPRISLTGLLGLASTALTSLFTGSALSLSAGADVGYTVFDAGAGRANVRLTEAQRAAAVASYQRTIQSAFREVADALARRGTINDEIGARQRQKAAAADTYLLTEARYRAGIDNFLASLDAQRSLYAAQRTLVQTQLTASQNLVELYQAIGGDPLLQNLPVCQPLPSANSASSANVASQCSPI